MGKGKGAPEGFVAPVTPGRIIIEAEGVSYEIAKEALRLAAKSFLSQNQFVVRRDYDIQTSKCVRSMKTAEIKEMPTSDLAERVEAEVANYNQVILNHSISPLDNPAQIKQLRRTIARMKTELRQRELNNKMMSLMEARNLRKERTGVVLEQQDG